MKELSAWIALILVVTVAGLTVNHYAEKNDWNGEQFKTICDYRDGTVIRGYDSDLCVKKLNGGTSIVVLIDKTIWLEERNK